MWRELNSELIRWINYVKLIIKKSCDSKSILGCVLASEDRNIWDGSK